VPQVDGGGRGDVGEFESVARETGDGDWVLVYIGRDMRHDIRI